MISDAGCGHKTDDLLWLDYGDITKIFYMIYFFPWNDSERVIKSLLYMLQCLVVFRDSSPCVRTIYITFLLQVFKGKYSYRFKSFLRLY